MHKLFILLSGLLYAATAGAGLNVFACEPEWAELARALGGERVEVYSATTADQDVHYIQARPGLIARLRRADVLVCTGAGLEAGWLPVLQRRAANPAVMPGQPGYLEASSAVQLLDRPVTVDRAHGDVHPGGNPHFHLDPRNIPPVARLMAERFAQLDPQHAAAYRDVYTAFDRRWTELLHGWEQRAGVLRGKRVVVHHVDWDYLLAWLGMVRAGTLEPKPGVPPASGHLAALLESLQAQPADCIVRTRYQPVRASKWLGRRASIDFTELPHTVTADDSPRTLEQLFDELLRRLAETCR